MSQTPKGRAERNRKRKQYIRDRGKVVQEQECAERKKVVQEQESVECAEREQKRKQTIRDISKSGTRTGKCRTRTKTEANYKR
jgi:hypothetical protein